MRPPARSADPVSSPVKKYPCNGVTFKIGGTNPTFVPPILNVTTLHEYFFTGEETGSADRSGGLTCGNVTHTNRTWEEEEGTQNLK